MCGYAGCNGCGACGKVVLPKRTNFCIKCGEPFDEDSLLKKCEKCGFPFPAVPGIPLSGANEYSHRK